MERPELENERRRLAKNKEKMSAVQCAPRRMIALPLVVKPPAPTVNQVQLAAVAVDLNVRLRSADMPAAMQERVIRHSRVLLDANADNKRLSPTHLAMCLKKEFDALYGPAWHCIVGKSFGSFVTHSSGGFVYFSIDKLFFLLFKTEDVQLLNIMLLYPLLALSNLHRDCQDTVILVLREKKSG